METEPNAQLVLIWLLDYLQSRADASITKKLILYHVDGTLGGATPKELARWQFPSVGITKHHFEIATLAWRAYREPTPQAWFRLLNQDLSILPQLRRCVMELLEELPGRTTGLWVRIADTGTDLGRLLASVRRISSLQAALSTARFWLLGGRRHA